MIDDSVANKEVNTRKTLNNFMHSIHKKKREITKRKAVQGVSTEWEKEIIDENKKFEIGLKITMLQSKLEDKREALLARVRLS